MKKIHAALIGSNLIFLLSAVARAGSATWDLNPVSGNWDNPANWTPMTVPNSSTDTAAFGVSTTTDIFLPLLGFPGRELDGITFAPGASHFTITASADFFPSLTLSGVGITNNSGTTQNFVTQYAAEIDFVNGATAGSSTTFTNNGGQTRFLGNSSAADGTFINNSAFSNSAQAGPGVIDISGGTAANATFINKGAIFSGNSFGGFVLIDSGTAANGTFINESGAVGGAKGGHTDIFGGTAGNGTFINDGAAVSGGGGGVTEIAGHATADSAVLIANGGTSGGSGGAIFFENQSTGGTSRVEVFGNGFLDISGHDAPGVTVGSIKGDGNVFLGFRNLTVGTNNMNTTFSGVIQDGGENGGTGGSLTKIGSGTLILSGASTYSGGTRVTGDFATNSSGGVLQVDGSITSNTFVGPLSELAGIGTVGGDVTVGNQGAVSPGDAPGVLTVSKNYTQTQWGTLSIQIAGVSPGQFSVLDVTGTANLNGYLDPVLLNGFVPTIGESFTFMNYASVTGAFSRIENQVFDNGMEQWNVSYQGTDAILTVGPNTIPDRGSSLLLLTLSLLGLVIYRRQLLRKQA